LAALLASALAAGALAVTGCAAPGGDGGPAVDDGSRSGQLAVYISDDEGRGSETTYYLRDASGKELKLVFDSAAPSELEPNALIKVWGVETADGLQVTSYQRLPPPAEPIRSALIGAPAFAERSFAFVFVDIGGGINTTADAVQGIMETNADSIKNYYLGDSYQMQSITTTVFGPIQYPLTTCANSDTSTLASMLRPMITGTFQHYLWYFGSKNAACSWSGLASVGTAQAPSRDTWYNASTNCVVLVQEPGHNFGMQHSSSLACPGASFADDPNGCTASEYGDRFDPMGGGCRHMNAWQKAYQGWFGGCNGVKVTNTGTFNLVPFELACNGAQFLQVAAPKARTFMRPAAGGGAATTENLAYYYVEVRTPNDFDGTLGNRSALTPMVLVHVADDLHTRTQRGVHTFLLDMTPATTGTNGFSDAGLAVGQTFTDPAGGVSITTQSLSATGAVINVTFAAGSGDPTCLDGTTFAAPGPGIESCNGAGGTGAGGTNGSGTGGRGGSGAGGTTGAAGTSPSSSGEAGSGVIPAVNGITGGCACTAAPGRTSAPIVVLALAFAAGVARRRRAKAARRSR
jgi:MYXO-CTERM domain-containing protein